MNSVQKTFFFRKKIWIGLFFCEVSDQNSKNRIEFETTHTLEIYGTVYEYLNSRVKYKRMFSVFNIIFYWIWVFNAKFKQNFEFIIFLVQQ